MSHENMYVAEKEMCNSRLIEVEKLNDVKGIGRQQKRQKKLAPPPKETVLECRGGVLARVAVPAASLKHDPSEPFVADGAELLAGLSEEQRKAILLGESLAGAAALGASDFARPVALPSQVQERSASASTSTSASVASWARAPPPAWARRRKQDGAARGEQQQQQQREREFAEADTDEECEPAPAPPKRHRGGADRKRGGAPASGPKQPHLMSFTTDEVDSDP